MDKNKNLKKDLLLLKFFTISLAFFYLIISIITFYKLDSKKVSLLFFTYIFCTLSALLMTKYINQFFAKFFLVLFFPISLLVISVYTKCQGISNSFFLYITPKSIIILSLLLPFLLFSFKKIKFSLLASFPILLMILFFDSIHIYFGINLKELPVEFKYQSIYLFVNLIGILIYLLGFMSLKYINFNNEKELRSLNHQLAVKTKDLEVSNQTINKKNTLLKDFAHSLSHDLKSPLHAVMALISFSKDDIQEKKIQLPKEIYNNINEIENRIELMNELITQLLINAEKGEDINKVVFNPKNIIKKIKNLIKIPTDYKIEIKDIPNLYMNVYDFQQIAQNLITNSIKYNDKKHGELVISSTQDNQNIYIHFKDNGIGIKEENFKKIFNIFETILKQEKNSKNTGIGLSIVKKLVVKNNGKIEVTSKYGKWTNFAIKFPVSILE